MFPAELGDSISIALIALSAATSFLSAAAGIGGGVVLIAVMASLMPAHAVIPVHGVVQIGSNAGRTAIMIKHIDLRLVVPFTLGSIVGAALGGVTAVQLSAGWLQVGLAFFILYAAWGPKLSSASHGAAALTGVFSTFLTMFFGATGMFVSAMVKTLRLGRLEHVATHAGLMVVQHAIKVITFGLLGFAYGPYIWLMVGMIASGFVGTMIGKRLLIKLNDELFHRVLSVVLTLLALRLLYQGATSLL